MSGASSGRAPWPVRSGNVPALAAGYSTRPETDPGLAAALPAGSALALVPDRLIPGRAAAGPAAEAGPGPDWLRSSGKTQLAVAYAESLWLAGGLDLLVWIQAGSREAVLSGYAAATAAVTGREQAISAEEVAAQFLSWLRETSRRWLVVLDDLADPAGLDGLWPAGATGRLLATCAGPATVPRGLRTLPVGLFNSREALGYLLERLAGNPGQRLGAMDLVSAVGLEPAALAQASAVIASSTISCHQYSDYFAGRRQQLSDPSGPPPSSAVTWTLSYERACQLAPAGWVQSLLAVTALLDGQGIPATALTAPALAGYLAEGGGGGAGAAGLDPAQTTLAALERTGLVTITPAGTPGAPPTVRISPVLQAELRAVLPAALLERAVRLAADALLQAWPEADLPGWPAAGLRSCAAALWQAAGDRLWSDGCQPVLLRAGDSLDAAALTGPAVEHWGDLVTTSGRLLGPLHPLTVLTGQRLAEALLAAGRPDEALPWLQRLIDARVAQLGPDHPDVTAARQRLGHALLAGGQSGQAIAVFERLLAEAGQADPSGLRDELAAAYLAAGRYADAANAYRQVLADRERAQGPRHPQAMTTRLGLADALLSAGQAKEAVSGYKRVVADRERALGPDHLDTTRARARLGAAYQATGKTAAAERVFEQARSGFERALGPRHPDALRSRAELARVYHQLGRYGDARALLRDTAGRLERVLPPGDPLVAELHQLLADIGDE